MGFSDGSGISWTMQTICTSLQTDNHTNTSSLSVYRPDAGWCILALKYDIWYEQF